MFIENEIMKIRVLLFLSNNIEQKRVVDISRTLDISKQRASKTLIRLEDDGYVDRTDHRNPKITEAGKAEAKRITERITVVINYLMFEGVPLEVAEADAYKWAILNTEETMDSIRRAEKKCRIKHSLKGKSEFNGDELCKLIDDGKYNLEFAIYRNHMNDKQFLSMANEGFEHPGCLEVKDGKGKITVKIRDIKTKSEKAQREIKARADTVHYLYNNEYIPVELRCNSVSIPAEAINFINLGDNIHPTYHGSVGLKIKSNIDTFYMPESEAMFTVVV